MPALLFLLAPQSLQAGSAAWNLNPATGDWNTATNWMPNTVPNGRTNVATFGASSITEVSQANELAEALERSEIRLVTSKTGRQQIIWMAEPLRRHVENLAAGDDPKQPLHPRAFASVLKSGKVGTLSRQFHELMADAGLAKAKAHRAATINAPGRNGRRDISEISFHALRHTAASLLKNAGVSSAIVQDIIGHESAAIFGEQHSH